jgi:hypothetical protein
VTPNTVQFLESLGFEFGLDWDGEVQVRCPPDIPSADIAAILCEKHLKDVREFIKHRADFERRQFVGGPLNGRKHAACYWTKPVIVADLEEWEVRADARWAVYVLCEDGRARFIGLATSEAKGRKAGFDAARAAKHPMVQ